MAKRRGSPSRAGKAGSNVRSSVRRSSARSGSRVQQHIKRMRAMGAPGFRRAPGQSAGMSRAGFLRRAGVAGAGVAAAGLGLGGVAKATLPSYDAVVYPEDGIAGVKAAVGDPTVHSVLLKATTMGGASQAFNFGNDWVEIHQDKIIHGEQETKIIGGGPTTSTGDPYQAVRGAFTVMAPVAFEFQYLHFDKSNYASILVSAGNGIIANNKMTDPKIAEPVYDVTWKFVGPIVVTELWAAQGPINGNIYIENNEVGVVPAGADYTDAIVCANVDKSINIYIRNNKTTSLEGVGIGVIGSPDVIPYIEGNNISSAGDGIHTFPFFGPSGPKTVFISDNTIECGNFGIDCHGLTGSSISKNFISAYSGKTPDSGLHLFECDTTSVDGNTINMAAWFGVALVESDTNTIQGNKITGHYNYPVRIQSGSNNVFLGNNIVQAELWYPDMPNCTAQNPGALLSALFMTPVGNALDFSGSDYVQISPLTLNSNTVTYSAWIKANGDQASWSALIFNRGSTDKATGINFRTNNELGYHWDNQNWGWSSGITVPTDQWVFVALVVEPTKATLYMHDGTTLKSKTNTVNHSPLGFNDDTFIGRDPGYGTDRAFNGFIDEVHIFNTALSQAQVEQLMTTPGQFGPIAYYSFNNADIVRATDTDPGPNLVLDLDPNGEFQVAVDKVGSAPFGNNPGIINLANCPDQFQPAVFLLDSGALNNTVKGYSGGSVVDEPEYEGALKVLFAPLGSVRGPYGPWWIASNKHVENYNWGSAGYANDDPAKPNCFERDENPSYDVFVVTSGPYGPYFQGYRFNPVKSSLTIPTPWDFEIPDPNPPSEPLLILDGKQNYITGFEPMTGGIGQHVSTVKMSPEWQAWKAAFDSHMIAWFEANPDATHQEVNAEIATWMATPGNEEPPKHDHEWPPQ